MRGDRVQVQGAVRLMAMQKNRHADHGHVGHGQREQNDLPPGNVPQAVGQPIQSGVKQDHECIL
jgi:hypothetical protein